MDDWRRGRYCWTGETRQNKRSQRRWKLSAQEVVMYITSDDVLQMDIL